MRLVPVGDLHLHPWSWWPGVNLCNEYIQRAYHYLTETVPALVEKTRADGVVVMGDVAEEPSATGKIPVAVLVAAEEAFGVLAKKLGADRRKVIIMGNHDYVGGYDWLGVLARSGWDVVRDLLVEGNVAYVAAKPRVILHTLLTGAQTQGAQVVFGHYVYKGALMDNGLAYADSETADAGFADSIRLSVLGHAHTPADYATTSGGRVVYTGSALRYSWAQRDVGPRALLLVDTQTMECTAEPVDCPAFVGPTDQIALLESLPDGSFVRFSTDPGNDALMGALRKQYPKLRLIPVQRESVQTQQAPRLDVGPAEALPSDDASKASILDKYVGYCAGLPGGIPVGVDPATLLAYGSGLLKEGK